MSVYVCRAGVEIRVTCQKRKTNRLKPLEAMISVNYAANDIPKKLDLNGG